MARIVLLRHAHSVANEKNLLAGRTGGIALSKTGKSQAEDLIARLGATNFDEVAISPLQRCRETIDPWLAADGAKSPVVIDESVSEVDYGNWSGKTLASLRRKSQWKVVQDFPSQMIFPEGESLLEMQGRALSGFYRLNALKGKGPRLLVSHGDVIKSLIASALELDLDKFQKIVIDPASISVLDYSKGNFRLLHINDSTTCFDFLSDSKRSKKALVGGGSGSK